jgi:hypothetical protein
VPSPPIVVSSPSTAAPTPSQPLSPSKSQLAPLAQMTEYSHITPTTLTSYCRLLLEAEQYERRYKTIGTERKKQLAARIKDTMNKLRKDTFTTLTNELFEFLNGQEQKVTNQSIRILNDEGKNFF